MQPAANSRVPLPPSSKKRHEKVRITGERSCLDLRVLWKLVNFILFEISKFVLFHSVQSSYSLQLRTSIVARLLAVRPSDVPVAQSQLFSGT